eukprot:TRINITY_DN2128_c0_g1_i1.p1 TRINITY_DN2128_c0_g1~~TRINITY_DN2128_c0_g1_i1.p1  ORF type:complete len:136 (-),score=27.87 TRINITY_DN2128_c0_g1_i1:260-667(-)
MWGCTVLGEWSDDEFFATMDDLICVQRNEFGDAAERIEAVSQLFESWQDESGSIGVCQIIAVMKQWALVAMEASSQHEVLDEIHNTLSSCQLEISGQMRRHQFLKFVAILFDDIENDQEFLTEMNALAEIHAQIQ